MRAVHCSEPNGQLCFIACANAADSAAVCGVLTHFTQSLRRRTGQGLIGIKGISFSAGRPTWPRLDQRHRSARSTMPARTGFRSTYRSNFVRDVKRCRT